MEEQRTLLILLQKSKAFASLVYFLIALVTEVRVALHSACPPQSTVSGIQMGSLATERC